MGIDIVGLTQLQKPPENQKNKKQTNSFDPWRGSKEKLDRWHGVKLFGFLCFFVFPWVLGRFWAKVAKKRENQKKQKKTKSFDPWKGLRRSWTGDMFFFVSFVFFVISMVLDQLLPLSEFGLFVWEFVIDPSFRNGSRSANRMIFKISRTVATLSIHPSYIKVKQKPHVKLTRQNEWVKCRTAHTFFFRTTAMGKSRFRCGCSHIDRTSSGAFTASDSFCIQNILAFLTSRSGHHIGHASPKENFEKLKLLATMKNISSLQSVKTMAAISWSLSKSGQTQRC